MRPLSFNSPSRRPLWLLGADICVFTRLDLRNVPPRHRSRAVAERARQLCPFVASGWYAADQDGDMALWCWDGDRVRAAIDAEGDATDSWDILPEQVFLAPANDACLRTSGGTEILERWRDGALVFSAALPADAQRALWFRSAGIEIDSDPARVPSALLAARWDQRALDWRALAREPLVGGLAALGLACLWLLWSAGTLAGWQFANQRLEARLEQQQAALAPVLGQRDEALRLAARNEALGKLLGQVSAIEAAAEFEFLAGTLYDRLLSWEFNARSLRATLEDNAPDNRAYVEALQRSPWFERVSVAPTARPDQISLEISLSASATEPPAYLAEAAGGSDDG